MVDYTPMNQEIFQFWQDVSRERGYLPFPIEIPMRFRIEMDVAQQEVKAVKERLAEIVKTIELPKQSQPSVVNAIMPLKKMPQYSGKIDLKRFTGRNGWPDARDCMIYWQVAATNKYVMRSVDYVIHDEQIALVAETESFFYSADSVRLPLRFLQN